MMRNGAEARHQLPELPESSGFGPWIVRHTLALTVAILLLLAAALAVAWTTLSPELTLGSPPSSSAPHLPESRRAHPAPEVPNG